MSLKERLFLSDLSAVPTCTGDIVLLQKLVVSTGADSASWDGEAEGTTAPIIHLACIVTCRYKVSFVSGYILQKAQPLAGVLGAVDVPPFCVWVGWTKGKKFPS